MVGLLSGLLARHFFTTPNRQCSRPPTISSLFSRWEVYTLRRSNSDRARRWSGVLGSGYVGERRSPGNTCMDQKRVDIHVYINYIRQVVLMNTHIAIITVTCLIQLTFQ